MKSNPNEKSAEENILQLRDFCMAFGENVLFTNFDYTFKPGIYAFSGPSGVGKSTVMCVIAGLETRHTGDVILNGNTLTSYTPEIHMVHQHYTSFPWLSVLKNTLMVYKGHKKEITDADVDEAKAILERLGLGEHLDKLPSQLSGGQDQRLSLANAFINKWSKVILYDEPTSALDIVNDMLIVDMIKEHQQKHNTIEIVITHEDHVVEGLGAKILEFTPEFRLKPPKVKKAAKTAVVPQKPVQKTQSVKDEEPVQVQESVQPQLIEQPLEEIQLTVEPSSKAQEGD